MRRSALTVGDLEASIRSLTQVLASNPTNTAARQALYVCMREMLTADPRLAYRGESSAAYQLQTPTRFVFEHPKDRSPIEARPSFPRPAKGGAYGWLKWAVVGLLPAGLGTLIFAPLAAASAARLLRSGPSPMDRRRALTVIWLAAGLWLAAWVFLAILIVHVL